MQDSKKKGWVRLHRVIEDWPLYFSEPFTKAQAWIDMFMLANHSKIPKVINVRGNLIEVKRGQLAWSNDSLACRWFWSRNKVRRFQEWLETNKQTIQQKSAVLTVITIVNYEKYQSDESTDDTTERQQTIQQTDTNKNDKNDKNEKNTTNVVGKTPTEKKYGNEKINQMLEFLRQAVGVTDFKEPRQQQRQCGNNLVRLMEKLTRQVFAARLEAILADNFHRKNCGALDYIYRQVKGFVSEESGISKIQKDAVGFAIR